MNILSSIRGRRFGLGPNGELILNNKAGVQNVFGNVVDKTITTAQLLALNATAIEIVAAPEAGAANILRKMAIHKPAGVAYAGVAAGEDLVAKLTDDSGEQVSGVVETTGFLDQTTAETRIVGMPGASGATAGSYEPLNAAIVLHLLVGEVITGDSDIHVRTWFDQVPLVF